MEDLEKKTDKIVSILKNTSSCFVLGKGNCEAIAKEGSLKIKEISSIHCEGYSTSSLKHGPFALLCENLPVCVFESENLELSLDQFYYSFPVKFKKTTALVKTNTVEKGE